MIMKGCRAKLVLGAFIAVAGGCVRHPVMAPGTGLSVEYVLHHMPWEVDTPRTLAIRRPKASGRGVRVGELLLGVPAGWHLLGSTRHVPDSIGRVTFGLPDCGKRDDSLILDLYIPLRYTPSTLSDYEDDPQNYWKPYIARQYNGGVRRFFGKYRSVWDLWRAAYRTTLRDLKVRPGAVVRRERCLMFLRYSAFAKTRFWCDSGGVRAAVCYGQPKLRRGKCVFALDLFDGDGNEVGDGLVRSHGLAPREALHDIARLLAISRIVLPPAHK